ncbi:polyphenol oxidase, chloroplastic-like [Gossypium arboreum]|uniref:Tyrosinase copper-binding domain-containing protein n=1 Tax=Gossypium arboreum TaxID=29729 RepID=A0ABR0PQT4_GOSAR|nr:polyphenol oxidase, chloroplastic-like [Gossypium arboreum]KAK5826626.1 hypothetical protein PVK06_021552 [Gossypium arboreum]
MASTTNSPSTLLTLPNFSIQTSTFLPKTSQRSIFKKKKPFNFNSKRVVSCKASNGKQNDADTSFLNRFDRRDILLGLGGSLYGATSLVRDPFALAYPIEPDLSSCGESTVDTSKACMNVPCCPPKLKDSKIIDFEPPLGCKIRYRPAAHLVDRDYLYKFESAMERMKALPVDDPRNFMQQANIHCAYCNGAYSQVGFPDQKLEVHYSWLFFPFHRMYLYFFERILGKLIGDPDFAMPFWNWDSPCGMTMPQIYLDPYSPLYDENRNLEHQQDVVNLNDGKSVVKQKKKNDDFDELTKREQIKRNLCVMYQQMVRSSKTASCFHGAVYRAGCVSETDIGCTPEPRGGTIENGAHLAVHKFVGAKNPPYNEDMGNFYSAGRDPLFYAHHGNVDRMWNIWKTLPGKKRRDFDEKDWLNSSFLFYDENANMVRVKVRDCLDSKTLGYDYQSVDIPWLRSKPTPRRRRPGVGQGQDQGQDVAARRKGKNRRGLPIVLDKVAVRIEIPRLKKPKNKDDEEVLVLQNIQLDRNDSVQFDVSINDDEDDDNPCKPEESEFVGSFTNIPHGDCHSESMLSTNLYLPLSEALEDLEIQREDSIVVTLVPKEGEVSIGNIKIDYVC